MAGLREYDNLGPASRKALRNCRYPWPLDRIYTTLKAEKWSGDATDDAEFARAIRRLDRELYEKQEIASFTVGADRNSAQRNK
jgi:hypothetical protein